MMVLCLRQFADQIGELQRTREVLEPEAPLQPGDAVNLSDRPVRYLQHQILTFSTNDGFASWGARFAV